jgi:chemotaxis protein MotB
VSLYPYLFALLVGAASLTGCASTDPPLVDPSLVAAEQARADALQAERDAALAARDGARAALDEARTENARLRARLGAADAQGLRGETVGVLQTDLYFESGSAQLTPAGVAQLELLARRLQTEYAGREVRVEGYTDDRPIKEELKATYPSNWELSAARAAMVARHLQWTHGFAPERLVVVGYGSYRPLADNATEEGRRENRRVRLAVLD